MWFVVYVHVSWPCFVLFGNLFFFGMSANIFDLFKIDFECVESPFEHEEMEKSKSLKYRIKSNNNNNKKNV